MTLLIDNEVVRRVLTPGAVRRALESAYRDLASGEAVCRPRIDIRIPTRDPEKFYQWGTMEGGSTGGYFAIRMKSDIVYEREYEGVRTQEKYCSRPGRYCGLVFLTDVETGAPLAISNDGHLQHLRVAADSAIGTDIMAREDCRTLGMLGSGGMAASHVEALLEVRKIERIRVFSPTRADRARHGRRVSGICRAPEGPPVGNEPDGPARAAGDGQRRRRQVRRRDRGQGPRPHFAKSDLLLGARQHPGRSVFRRGRGGLRRGAARRARARPAHRLVLAGHTRLRKRLMKNTERSTAALVAWTLLAGSAWAQTLFNYSGADRMEKIIAAAKKEGTLTMYTTFAEKDQPTLIRPFEAKYGVKVNIWRAGTDKVLQRTLAEAAAKKYDVDLIHFGSPEMEALSREKILQAVNSPVHKELQPGSVPAHREWAATLLSVWVQVYNTNLIKKSELPRAYKDLLDPKWKGKLGIEAKDEDWFASVVDIMGGGEKGLQFFRDLMARNGISARMGHTLLK